jgi:release factor glutamine methyltransferase
VDPRVLIPRPETELVVDLCKGIVPAHATWRVADVCTGSGNLGVTLCCEFPGLQCVMGDISFTALQLARRNARRLGVAERSFACRLGFAFALKSGSLDLAVCNPPYIAPSEYDVLSREIVGYEPKIALLGGREGLELPWRAVGSIASCLRPGGYLILETGREQAQRVASHMVRTESVWSQVRVHLDLRGDERCVSAQRV